MDTTKLRPSEEPTARASSRPAGPATPVPGRDHYSIWYDRESKRYLFADEPYEPAAAGQGRRSVQPGLSASGFDIVKAVVGRHVQPRRRLAVCVSSPTLTEEASRRRPSSRH